MKFDTEVQYHSDSMEMKDRVLFISDVTTFFAVIFPRIIIIQNSKFTESIPDSSRSYYSTLNTHEIFLWICKRQQQSLVLVWNKCLDQIYLLSEEMWRNFNYHFNMIFQWPETNYLLFYKSRFRVMQAVHTRFPINWNNDYALCIFHAVFMWSAVVYIPIKMRTWNYNWNLNEFQFRRVIGHFKFRWTMNTFIWLPSASLTGWEISPVFVCLSL